MTTQQQPPRYRVHYEDNGLLKLALQKVGGDISLVDIDDYQCDRETSSLVGARSIIRALLRRGHLVQAVYERIGIRAADLSRCSEEYQQLHQGKEWEWDEETEVAL